MHEGMLATIDQIHTMQSRTTFGAILGSIACIELSMIDKRHHRLSRTCWHAEIIENAEKLVDSAKAEIASPPWAPEIAGIAHTLQNALHCILR